MLFIKRRILNGIKALLNETTEIQGQIAENQDKILQRLDNIEGRLQGAVIKQELTPAQKRDIAMPYIEELNKYKFISRLEGLAEEIIKKKKELEKTATRLEREGKSFAKEKGQLELCEWVIGGVNANSN